MTGRRYAAPSGVREIFTTVFRCGLLACAVALSAGAQEPGSYRYNGSGYVTYGMGICQHRVTNVSAGAGGEGFLWRGLTLGGDIGYYRFIERGRYAIGATTLNVGYNFANRSRAGRFDPFVNAGVLGLAFGAGGAARAMALGGGTNFWFKRRLGLRTEARLAGIAGEVLVMFRVGLAFR